MAADKDPIVYRYKPGHAGDGYPGVPPRDLRASDVAALEGAPLRDLTLADGGPYEQAEHHGDAAPTKKETDKKGGD